jgi:CHAT domain-containing protein/Tfp pilus assembly protein PilF
MLMASPLRRVPVRKLVFAVCLAVLLGARAAVAPGQPVPLPDEPTAEQRLKLEKETLALNELSVQRYREGRLDEATKLMEQVVRAYRRLYPPQSYPAGHRDLAISLDNLGTIQLGRGELDKAETYLRQALAMRLKLYPKERYPDGHVDLAVSLNNLAMLTRARGEPAQAEAYLRQALPIYQKLYPASRYPDGHADLARTFSSLSMLAQAQGELVRAEAFCRQALAMTQKLYPKERYPAGHPELALTLNNLGAMLLAQNEPAQAEPYLRQALAMRTKLYPSERFPDGHPELAESLSNLGSLLKQRGELAQAEAFFRRALGIYQKLYPPERYPAGHPRLAISLSNLASLLKVRGELAQAETYYRRAQAMKELLYPAERFPSGHPELAIGLNNLGDVLAARGELIQAETTFRRALAMYEKLYPPERYPNGHPDLATCVDNLGSVLDDQDELVQAEPYRRRTLAMLQKLYPKEHYPIGNRQLAVGLHNLGSLLWVRGEPVQAEPYFRQALTMYQQLVAAVLAGSAEAEGLNYLAELPDTRDGYLSVTRALPDKTGAAYAAVWQTKGAVARMLQQRRLGLLLSGDKATRALAADLAATRQALANLLRPGADLRPQQAERVRTLSAQKEKLEKQLADQLPLYKALQERLKRTPADLLPLLPPGAVFLDLTRYWHLERDPKVPGKKGQRLTLSYVAFVLTRGQPIRRVELGAVEPIDQALATWRRSLQAGQSAIPAADTLRRQLWRPLEKAFPAGTRTVILAPDAALTRLPWVALPAGPAGTMLLEEYALVTMPDGPFLLDLLRGPARARDEAGVLLAAGGIDYDDRAEPALVAAAQGLARAARPGKGQALWPALPGTATELAEVRRLAGKRSVIERRGVTAGTGQLLADLPKVRWAHLATHGFFADPAERSVLQLSAEHYQRSGRGERIGLGARSPLVLSGLVCAGANVPVKDPEKDDGGILTAEAIAGLDLDGLELAVLSACDTGLGESGGGEGVFGLQRAFHLAGARSVIASLWKIDDDATQALMAEFYRNLWERKLPRLEALRRAQLAMLLHYDAKAGRVRAPGAAVPVDPAELAAARAKLRTAGRPPLPPLYWAGFVLSGDWR